MKSLINALDGRKSYLVAFVAAVLNLAVALGYLSPAHLQEINTILAALGLAALRQAVN